MGLMRENKSSWIHHWNRTCCHPSSCETSLSSQRCSHSTAVSISLTVLKAPVTGLLFSSKPSSAGFTTTIVARMLNGLGCRFRSFRFGGITGSCRQKPYGIVGSLESESVVTICGSGDAMDDIEIISRISLPDITVELRTIGVFDLGGLWSLDDCSTKNTSESIEIVDKLEAIF